MAIEIRRYDLERDPSEQAHEWGDLEVATELAESTGGAISFTPQGRWTIEYNQGELRGVGRLAEPYPILQPYLIIHEPREHGFSLEFHEPVFEDGGVRFVAPFNRRGVTNTIKVIEFKDGDFYDVEILRFRASDALRDAQMIAQGRSEDLLTPENFRYSSPKSPPKTPFKDY